MPLTTCPAETRVVLDNVSWQTFETLLAETGPRRGRMAYEEGTLEIMVPSFEHEDLKSTLGTLLESKQRGLEPDESYYVQNEERVRGKKEIDLGQDPPPDIAIEIQITQSALDKLGIYAALGVPEVWLWEGDTLKVYWLEESGKYVESRPRASRALPGLPLDELLRFLGQAREKSTTRLANDFRTWVRETLPRGA
jgi:Uma2 family endonuclease